MSGFGKNVIPRRAHKERSQPASRISKHGLLEKKKDYKLRARDRNQKNLRVKLFREKAAFRNPDEFYYAMIRSHTRNGRLVRTVNTAEKNAVPIDNLKKEERMLAETQDSRYVALKLATEDAAMKKLADRLHFLEQAKQTPRTHLFFADNNDDADSIQAARNVSSVQKPSTPSTSNELSASAYKELEQRSSRVTRLRAVLNDMTRKKLNLSKGAHKVVVKADQRTGAPAVLCWRKERSK